MALQDQTPKDKPKSSENSRNVLIYALAMAFGTMSSRVLGLLRDMAFAALFERSLTDAWTTAFRLPNMFRRLFGEGALSVSFIPVFVDARHLDPSELRSRNLVNGLYTLLLLVLGALTALGIIFAAPILSLMLDANYSQVPGKFELTVRMAQIMFGFLFLISSYAYFMGILNALGKYALAAFAPVLWNVAMIASTFVPLTWLASPGDAIAWGVVVGGVLQTGILVPTLVRAGYFPRLSSLVEAWQNPDVRKVFRNMLPGLVGLGLLQITTIVNLRFASALGEGPISYIYWADRLMELPLSLVSVSLGTALLPTLSSLWSRGLKTQMTETANYYLRLNLFVSIPASVGLYCLALPIVEVLFMRGKFQASDAATTALVIQIYSLIVISSSLVRVFVPSFYAVKNTWLPAVVSGICLCVHLIAAPLLMARFGLGGLISSSVLSATLNFILLMIGYGIWIGNFGLWIFFRSAAKFVVAALAMGFVLRFQPQVLSVIQGESLEPHFIHRLITLILMVLAGGLTYVLASLALRAEELEVTLKTVMNKIRSRRKK